VRNAALLALERETDVLEGVARVQLAGDLGDDTRRTEARLQGSRPRRRTRHARPWIGSGWHQVWRSTGMTIDSARDVFVSVGSLNPTVLLKSGRNDELVQHVDAVDGSGPISRRCLQHRLSNVDDIDEMFSRHGVTPEVGFYDSISVAAL